MIYDLWRVYNKDDWKVKTMQLCNSEQAVYDMTTQEEDERALW